MSKLPIIYPIGITGSGKTFLSDLLARGITQNLPLPLRNLPDAPVLVPETYDQFINSIKEHPDKTIMLPAWVLNDDNRHFDIDERPLWPIGCVVPFAITLQRCKIRKYTAQFNMRLLYQIFNSKFDKEEMEKFSGLGENTDPIFLNMQDYPPKVINFNEIEDIYRWRFKPKPLEDRDWSRIFFRFNEYTMGGTDYFRNFYIKRWDTILPQNMTNMSMIDFGCHVGTFCVESINRGADYAVGVDLNESNMLVLQHIRDFWKMPISTIQTDLEQECLPITYKYDIGLLLNVLHRLKDPWKTAVNVSQYVNKLILEIPMTIQQCNNGEFQNIQPKLVNGALCAETKHFPPMWVQALGEHIGFDITKISISPYCPEQRMLFFLDRK